MELLDGIVLLEAVARSARHDDARSHRREQRRADLPCEARHVLLLGFREQEGAVVRALAAKELDRPGERRADPAALATAVLTPALVDHDGAFGLQAGTHRGRRAVVGNDDGQAGRGARAHEREGQLEAALVRVGVCRRVGANGLLSERPPAGFESRHTEGDGDQDDGRVLSESCRHSTRTNSIIPQVSIQVSFSVLRIRLQ